MERSFDRGCDLSRRVFLRRLLMAAPAALLPVGWGRVLAGSTRLKAGSATKAVLNAITTTAMVRLGKVFENLMLDLKPGSAKLRDRAVRIVQAAGSVSAKAARELLEAADGEVKTAIVMARRDLPAEESRTRLAAADGHVRKALEDAGADR